jgi:hypothetical protein
MNIEVLCPVDLIADVADTDELLGEEPSHRLTVFLDMCSTERPLDVQKFAFGLGGPIVF